VHLVVTEPFGVHRRGDTITDPAVIQEVLNGENRHKVVRVITTAAE
jgi:hypothetical protein